MRWKKRTFLWACTGLACILIMVQPGPAAENAESPAATQETARGVQRLSALTDTLETMDRLLTALNGKDAALKAADTEEEKAAIRAEIAQIKASLEKRREEFETIASGGELEIAVPTSDRPFDLREEIQEIVRPLIEELKNVTKRPREIESLRRRIDNLEKTLQKVRDAVASVEGLMASTEDPKLKGQLEDAHGRWQEKEKEIEREIKSLQYQLDQKTASKQSVVKTLQESAGHFFKTRGLHLLLAFLAFAAIFFGLRFISWRLFRARAARAPETRSFYSRIFQVVYQGFTILAALAAALLLLYNFGDWMILSIALIVLVGVAWTARTGLSKFWEQSKLLLNIGTVREGERLIYDGIPWQVGPLNLQTTLTNSELSGGVLRLPLASLIGRQSRPYDGEEPWFPTRTGDYVTLADGTFGKVILQTPETVTMDVLGGCRKTYPAASFIGQNPVNLSKNNFGVGMTFGVDYAHQADVTRDIPERLRAVMMEDLAKEEFGADLIDVLVQFKEAAASSLDLLVWASFAGNAAPYYYAIGRVLQRIAVDACNASGWGIPFTQVTVHQAQAEDGFQTATSPSG